MTLDIEQEAGRDLFIRLVRTADVLVETFPPGYLEGMALDFERLRTINPGLIMASVTGFGQTGPRRGHESCDLVASALGGQMFVTGAPSTPPLNAFGLQSYYIGSLYAAIGIMLALRKRNRTGQGEHIDVSLQETMLSTLDHVMVRWFYEKTVAVRQGHRHWNDSFCILPCQDGHILITPLMHWETLVEWLDSEGMAGGLTERRWNDPAYRQQHADRIIETLQIWTRAHTVAELVEKGQLMHFPWAPVCSPKEVLESPQLNSRGFWNVIEHGPSGSAVRVPGRPYRSEESGFQPWSKAPAPGEHNLDVFRDELGLSDEELRRLASKSVI